MRIQQILVQTAAVDGRLFARNSSQAYTHGHVIALIC